MSIAKQLREIGRGREGARALDAAQAYELMSLVLDGRVTELELGAFAIAMRIKGETPQELAGFVDAAQERCLALRPPRPMIVLPSYNGARKLPNLTPLLALLLAQEGAAVLVHGPAEDPERVTSAEIFHDLGLPCARDASDVETAWARREPVFLRSELLCPPLARLLEARRVMGLRNSGHAVAKLLDPSRTLRSLRVAHHTHPEYGDLLASYVRQTGAHAMVLRGTEGEPVADPRRRPRLDVYLDGQLRAELSHPAHDGVLTELPVLPRTVDAATTARYIQSVVSGEQPAPAPLAAQADSLLLALEGLEAPGRAPVRAGGRPV